MTLPQAQRKRAKKPKTKTGCLTCKTRRVKCDEGKPFCERCKKYGIDCDGYPNHTSHLERTENERRRIMILPSTATDLFNVFSSSTPFYDSRQYMYFLHFQEQTARDLSGPFDEGLWSRVSLQACYNEPTLMHLVAAVGAIDKLRKSSDQSVTDLAIHKQQALVHYGQALKGIQKRINTPSPGSRRIILIASLLIYCFENLNGDVDKASKHMHTALQLMRKEISRKAHDYRHFQPRSPTADLEDSLVAAFVRLDNSLLSRPSIWDQPEKFSDGVLEMNYNVTGAFPAEFTSILEARNYLETLQFHNLPLLTKEMAARTSHRFVAHTDSTVKTLVEKARHFRNWKKSFEPLYERAAILGPNGARSTDFIAVATLRLQGITAGLLVESLFPNVNANLPTVPYDCLEILNLARQISEDLSYQRTFVFDCGIVPGVFFVLMSPVGIEVQREALRIMKSLVPRRDGPWDSATLVKVGETFLGVA